MTTTGYTRQAAADIVTGLIVEAPDFNAEFNKLQDFADATIGHTHDGTVGGGAPINLANSVDLSTRLALATGGTNADLSTVPTYATIIKGATALTYLKNNTAGTVAPATTDDINSGYSIGSMWYDIVHGAAYLCVNNASSAAVWASAASGSAIAAAIGNVRITTSDTTPATLNSKIAVSGALSSSITNAGANEVLNLAVTTATNAQTQALTDTTHPVTPGNLGALTGTTSQKGILLLASNAEVVTGTDTAKATTCSGVANAIATNTQALSGTLTGTITSGATAMSDKSRYRITGGTATLPTMVAGSYVIVEVAPGASTTITIGRNSQTIDGTAADDTYTGTGNDGPVMLYKYSSAGAVVSQLIGSTN